MPERAYLLYALVAGLCAGVSCGLVGVFVVTMHLSFLGVCVAHAAFAGALFAVWLEAAPVLGAMVFSLGAALAIGPLADRGDLSPDTSTGILFSLMLGLAFLFMGMMPGSRAEALSLFWGSLLTVTPWDIALLVACAVSVLALLVMFFKEVQAVVCHRPVAVAVGIPAAAVFYGMLLCTGATIAVSLQAIGGLLIYCLLLNPAAAAFQLTYSLKRMFLLSAAFGVASCWIGLGVSWLWDLPVGAATVLASSGVFAAATAFSPKRASRRR